MASLYVHIPFCNHICSYCDFAKVFYNEQWVERYLEALQFEFQQKKLLKNYDTIYIGGGTPSSLTKKQLQILLTMLQPYASHVQEYTIEVNPESMDDSKLDLMIKYGINRLSIGVQTFHDDLLKRVQRQHTYQDALLLIKKAKEKGIEDINVDLIYGLPDQTLNQVYEDIDYLDQLDIGHVSVYSLILEDHTLLKNENYQPLDDEEDAFWYESINSYLQQKGYHHYEVSNYYRKKKSMHNLVYWHYQDYDGVGLSAHSLKNHHRYENTRSLTQYCQYHFLEEDIVLNEDDELFEKLMMGLRLVDGVCIEEVNHIFHIDLIKLYDRVIQKYVRLHMLEVENGYLKTTFIGMNYLNNILIDMMDIKK